MKKALLLIGAAFVAAGAFAQNRLEVPRQSTKMTPYFTENARGNAVGDSFILAHFSLATDTPRLPAAEFALPLDSGFLYGTNGFSDRGFAERYDFNGTDSTVSVRGLFAGLYGRANAASTRVMSFRCWAQGPTVQTTIPTRFVDGTPTTVLASSTRNVNTLFPSTAYNDTLIYVPFNTPTALLADSFFVGVDVPTYSWNTVNGDTFAVFSSKFNARTGANYYVKSNRDTVISVRDAILDSAGLWENNDQYGLRNYLYLFPRILVGARATSTEILSRNGFHFFGNYPNPATSSTNIRYTLDATEHMTIRIMSFNGALIREIDLGNVAPGEHTEKIDVSGLASGNYLYLIHTESGSGVATEFSVVR